MSNIFIEGRRIADEDIYLKEDRYDKPKEDHKFLAKIVLQIPLSKEASLLDVGCATGEFIYYLKSQNSDMKLYGIDISEKMVLQARRRVKGAQFRVQSIFNPPLWSGEKFDLIVCNSMDYHHRKESGGIYRFYLIQDGMRALKNVSTIQLQVNRLIHPEYE